MEKKAATNSPKRMDTEPLEEESVEEHGERLAPESSQACRVELLNWRRDIKRHHLLVIVSDNPESSAHLVNRAIRQCKPFDLGSVFVDRAGYNDHRKAFDSPPECCETVDDLMANLDETFIRQWGHGSFNLSPTQLDEMDGLADEGARDRFRRDAKPLHRLPKGVFGPSLPPDIYQRINRFLLVPKSHVVLYHLSFGRSDATWLRRATAQRCLAGLSKPEHKCLRILVVAPHQAVPKAIIDGCQWLMLFVTDPTALRKWHKYARACIPKAADFVSLHGSLHKGEGLVLHLDALRPNLSDMATARSTSDGPIRGPASPGVVYWTTARTAAPLDNDDQVDLVQDLQLNGQVGNGADDEEEYR